MAKRHPSGLTGADVPKDSADAATPCHVGSLEDGGDICIVPNVGVFLSVHRVYDYEKEAREKSDIKQRWGNDKNAPMYRMAIPTNVIIGWANEIRKHQDMEEVSRERRRQEEYAAMTYPGTDTIDPEKDKDRRVTEGRNNFWIDKSRSSVLISKISANKIILNGSAVTHAGAVAIRINGPDGREIVEAYMSYDQFAAALFTTMHTPCTINHYWSIEDNCVRMQEVVKPPDSIRGRVIQRVHDGIGRDVERIKPAMEILRTKIEAKKPLAQKEMQEIYNSFSGFPGWVADHVSFISEQAVEEVTAVVETAAIHLAHTYGTSTEGMNQIGSQTFLSGFVPHLNTPPTPEVRHVDVHVLPDASDQERVAPRT